MMNRVRRFPAPGAAVAVLLVSTPALAQPAPSTEPWQYREEAESCRAYRWFGTGEDRLALQLRSFGPGSAIEAMVVSSKLPREPHSVRLVELGWNGKAGVEGQTGLLGSVSGIPSITMLLSHRPISAFAFVDEGATLASAFDPASQKLQLRVVGHAPMEIQTGSLEEPLRRLMECEARLMDKWGWGTDYAQRVASSPVALDPQLWFFHAITYPAVANLKRVSSFLQLRLKVDARGRVADCVVQSSPGSSEFGTKNCERLLKRGRYRPALDSGGQPVESFLQMSVIFAQYD